MARKILKTPIISEKASHLSESGVYIFEIDKNANKFEVRKAVENAYKVKVKGVNMVKVLPKKRIFRGKTGFRPGYKKAFVFLEKGEKIDLGV